MRAVAFRQDNQSRAIQIHAAQVQIVRVLFGPNAAGPEPRLPLFRVDPLDASNDPLAFGDRILDRAGLGVDQIQVIPPAPLAHPHQFVVAEPETE